MTTDTTPPPEAPRDIAASLYGRTTPTGQQQPPAQTQNPPPEAPRDIAANLYAEKPAAKPIDPPAERSELVKMRDTQERRMYSAERTFAQVPAEEWAAGVPSEHRAIVARELREVYADHSIQPDEVLHLNSVASQITEKPSPETLQQWAAEAAQRHSREDLELAQKLAARDPAVKRFLEESGLGSHPVWVSKFVEFAQRERAKGRLQ